MQDTVFDSILVETDPETLVSKILARKIEWDGKKGALWKGDLHEDQVFVPSPSPKDR